MKRLLAVACACAAAAMMAVVPAAGAKSSASKHAVSAADEQYLKTSISGDLFEVMGGKLAKAKSHNPAVIKLANRLISDHSKSLGDAIKLAHKLGIEVPKSPLPSMVWELKVVASMHGKAFNRWYSSLEVFDHVQDIQETSDEIQDGTNSQIRDDARTELPMLKQHLALSRAALAKT